MKYPCPYCNNYNLDEYIPSPVNLEEVKNEQISVDGGHSPWLLDPKFVAQVYASLLLFPRGITGDYPISYDEIILVESTNNEAIAMVTSPNTIAHFIFLKRLARQDSSGIWTVIGYCKAR